MKLISSRETMKILRWKHTKKHFYDSVKRDRIPHALRVGRAILFDSTEIRKLARRNRQPG